MKNNKVDIFEDKQFPVAKVVITSLALILLLFTITGSFYTVDAGEKAVVLRFGAIQGEYGEGLHFKAPFIDNVVLFDTRVVKTQVRASSYSKDAQVIEMNVSINYRIGKSASDIYKNIGVDYANTVIAPAIQNSVKQVIAQYDAQTLLDGYGNATRDITDDLTTQLKEFGIAVVAVNIVNHDYSTAFEQSVEAKQLAIQSALKAENDLRRIEIEAQQKVAQANATAQANILQGESEGQALLARNRAQAESNLLLARSQAEALRLQKQEITPDLLRLRSIEVELAYANRWDGALPKTIMGGGQIPLVQMPESLLADEKTTAK